MVDVGVGPARDFRRDHRVEVREVLGAAPGVELPVYGRSVRQARRLRRIPEMIVDHQLVAALHGAGRLLVAVARYQEAGEDQLVVRLELALGVEIVEQSAHYRVPGDGVTVLGAEVHARAQGRRASFPRRGSPTPAGPAT